MLAAAAIAALVAVPLACFFPVLRAELLLWDDNWLISESRLVTAPDAGLLRHFAPGLYYHRYMPLTSLFWRALYQAFGGAPAAFHAASLAVHIVNGVLVFLVLRGLLGLRRPAGEGGAPGTDGLAAAFGALVWVCHPMRVENAAWVATLPLGLSVTPLLLGALAYRRLLASPGESVWRRPAAWLSLAALVVSLSVFTLGLAWPVALLALDLYAAGSPSPEPGAQRRLLLRRAAEKAPYVVVCVVFAVLNAVARAVTPNQTPPAGFAEFGAGSRLAQAAYVVVFHLWRPFLPWQQRVLDTTLVTFDPTSAPFLLSAGAFALLTLLAVRLAPRRPAAAAVWLAYVALLVPVAGLTERPHWAADRHGLLVAVLFSFLLALGVRALLERGGTTQLATSGGAACLVLALAALSARHVGVWRNTETLFARMLVELGGREPGLRGSILFRLAVYETGRQRPALALDALTAAVEAEPRNQTIRISRARLLEALGRLPEAAAEYRAALAIGPAAAPLRVALALALLEQGQRAEAATQLGQALATQGNAVEALRALAWIRATAPEQGLRDAAEAVRLAERARELAGPPGPEVLSVLAAAYAEAGRYDAARQAAEQALALPGLPASSQEALREQLEEYRSGRPHRERP